MMEKLIRIIFNIQKLIIEGKPTVKSAIINDAYLDEIPEDTTKKPVEIPKIYFKDDASRLRNEFKELMYKNDQLWHLVQDIAQFMSDRVYPDLVITMIYRTQAEQDEIYKNDPRYKEKPFKSPHQFYHAVDIRSRTFFKEQVEELVNYINNKYNERNYYKWTAKCHNVGLGDHFHIQFIRN